MCDAIAFDGFQRPVKCEFYRIENYPLCEKQPYSPLE